MAPSQVVILAGGLGVRLRPLTDVVPKPMALVGGRPFLEHVFRLLRGQGLDRIVLLTGYLGNLIESHFGDGADVGLTLSYVREPEPRGTAGAVRDARNALDESFLLLNGDTFLNCNYQGLHESLSETGAAAIMAVYDNRVEVARSNVRIDVAGRVAAYAKVPSDQMTHVDAGVYALRRTTLDHLPPDGPCSLEHDLFPVLAQRGDLGAYAVEERFYDIGTLERLHDASRSLAARDDARS